MKNLKNGSLVAALALVAGVTGCIAKDEAQPQSSVVPREGVASAGKVPAADPAHAKDTAPVVFKAKFTTTKGDFTVEVHRDWAPNGADRFFNLVKIGYFSDLAFFRVIKGFMVQFGIHGDPSMNRVWRDARIPDDPSGKQSNTPGMLTFATSGANSRTTQLFINYGNNSNLDSMGFSPIGKVTQGMDVVEAIEGQYGEGAPSGRGPSQGRVQSEGNTYLRAEFPKLDYIKGATILP